MLAKLIFDLLAKLFAPAFEAWLKDRNDRAEAEKAGALAQAARTETDADAEVQRTSDAGAAVDRTIASDDGLHEYERTDPHNRRQG